LISLVTCFCFVVSNLLCLRSIFDALFFFHRSLRRMSFSSTGQLLRRGEKESHQHTKVSSHNSCQTYATRLLTPKPCKKIIR
jgi:hypothetical protein